MDLAYWGFRYWPFERSFSEDRFFEGKLQEEALARLLFLVEEYRRSGIVMGPSGTGKSFLLRRLQHLANRQGRLSVRCDATGLNGIELASQIAAGCHIHCDSDTPSGKIWTGIHARFAAMALVKQPIVLIIDHFDFVEPSAFQTICRFDQLADSVGIKMTMFLVTRDRAVPGALQDLLDLKIELGNWTATECSRFISSSTTRAGSNRSLFSDEALESVYELTRGTPASVTSLCSMALLAARTAEESLVTREIVEAAAFESSLRITSRGPKVRLSHERPALATTEN